MTQAFHPEQWLAQIPTRFPSTPQLAHALAEHADADGVLTMASSRMPLVSGLARKEATGYGLLHVEASRRFATAAGPLRVFARIDNLLDRDHVGSVIVNEGNGRYYEPNPGRAVLLGLEWQLR